ncbi:hypothetical protein OPQ81_004072 [Rhizoctonia solani]|nr:hypothetical protein OPQ81_004072 [Rhizoctonia solani]
MDEDESSEGDSQRIAIFQKQAKRRYMNKHRPQQESLASLPGYTSQVEAEGSVRGVPPPKGRRGARCGGGCGAASAAEEEAVWIGFVSGFAAGTECACVGTLQCPAPIVDDHPIISLGPFIS